MNKLNKIILHKKHLKNDRQRKIKKRIRRQGRETT